jgi:hypothetical protein
LSAQLSRFFRQALKPFAKGFTVIHLSEGTLRISKSEWMPMENSSDTTLNFEAVNKMPSHKHPQVLTVYLTRMSSDRQLGTRISPAEYCEIFWLGAYPGIPNEPERYPPRAGYLVMQLRVNKGTYWVLSRESFAVPTVSVERGIALNQRNFEFQEARQMFPQFDLQEAVDRTRLLIQQTF